MNSHVCNAWKMIVARPTNHEVVELINKSNNSHHIQFQSRSIIPSIYNVLICCYSTPIGVRFFQFQFFPHISYMAIHI